MYARFVKHPFMSRATLEHFSAEALTRAMLRFELALAAAEETHGALPSGTHNALKTQLEAYTFDLDALEAGIVQGGNVAIPFVKQAKKALPDELKKRFHVAATSQDVVDSALMILTRERLPVILGLTLRINQALAALMRAHGETLMIGRTLMQQAMPMTFGVKAAQWAVGIEQGRQRLNDVAEHGLYVQFGGPVGVQAGLDDGLTIMKTLATTLGLSSPVLPWHTDRQPIHALITALDALACGAEKIATDISLLTQSEIGEVREPAGEGMGESSSMPHKHNPVRCALIRTAARQIHGHTATIINAAAQPLERALGEWHAEWAPLIESQALLEGALEQLVVVLEGLEVIPEAMQRNLNAAGTGGEAELGSSRAQVARVLAMLGE
ncbi:lyase family protein [Phytohalomonas tamaricis]|uniref:lyase family protein n=1 Tax=Phytohalomonas tamaricis TaxID=2081032 RepID=UPI000D0B39A5|nr:lyase family protein [Phytohalomonas tamaricis]